MVSRGESGMSPLFSDKIPHTHDHSGMLATVKMGPEEAAFKSIRTLQPRSHIFRGWGAGSAVVFFLILILNQIHVQNNQQTLNMDAC